MTAGAVGVTSRACVAAMLGQPIAESDLLPFLAGNQGTKNQRYMAAAAGLFAGNNSVRIAAEREADRLLADEEATGPSTWEIFAPDPHGGMYALAWVGVIAAGLRPGASPPTQALGRRAAVILGQMLRLGDLVATPDGDLRGLPGMRAPEGAGLGRRSLSAVWIEVRRRQPGVRSGLMHRGTGGQPRKLTWGPDSDPLVDGAACWLRDLLDRPNGDDELLRAPLFEAAPLPAHLRLPLTVWRGPTGTLAVFADPGPEHRAEYVITGSAAAKRDPNHVENPATWVKVTWGAPAHHEVAAGVAWQTLPPSPPPGAARYDIPGPSSTTTTPPRPVDPPQETPAPGPGKEQPLMPKTLGQALAVKFPVSRWISTQDGSTILTGSFNPLATRFYRNRYGVEAGAVYGAPAGQLQGAKSSIFWLSQLLADPDFLARNPEFQEVMLPDLSSGTLPDQWEQTDLEMAWSPSLGGAYGWLEDNADHRGFLGPKGPVAANSSPGAPGVAPSQAQGVDPQPPAAPVIAAGAQATAQPSANPPAAPSRQAAIAKITEGLEELFPGGAAKYGPAVALLEAGGKPSLGAVLLAALPLVE